MVERHYIKWDVEKSNRLYDFVAENPPLIQGYFSYQVGRAVVNFTKYFVDNIQNCKLLDYGCGLGFLSECFLKYNIPVYGVDMSPESVRICNEKFNKNPYWKGALVFNGEKLPYDDNTFDVITCTEVIEHILPMHMDLFLRELQRILKPNGRLIMTTPNDEDFTKNYVCCPECYCIFHKHGHVNKFSKKTLAELMEKYNYSTIMCNSTNFYSFQETGLKFSIRTFNIDFLINKLKKIILAFRDIKNKGTLKSIQFVNNIGNGPNLFWVGTKN